MSAPRAVLLLTLTLIAMWLAACGGPSTVDRPTIEVLGDLRVGMPAEEVEDVLGEPAQRLDQPQSGGQKMLYDYETEDARVAVVFEDGAVTDFRGTDRVVTISGG